jgi:hypothetical protein
MSTAAPSLSSATHHKSNTAQRKAHIFMSQYENVYRIAGCQTVSLFCVFIDHAVHNKEGLWVLNHLSSAKQNTPNHKLLHICAQYVCSGGCEVAGKFLKWTSKQQ